MTAWLRAGSDLVAAIALVKVAAGGVALTVAWASGTILATDLIPPGVRLLLIAAYGLVGVALWLDGRHDPRSHALGVFLLLIASAFAHGSLRIGHALGGVSAFALHVHVEALLPAALWTFVRAFPSPLSATTLGRVAAAMLAISIVTGIGLAIDSATLETKRSTVFWIVTLAMMVPAAPVLLVRARMAGPEQQRPVALFAIGVVAGLLPLAVDVLLRFTVPAWAQWVTGPRTSAVVVGLVVVGLVSVPFSTAWAVMVDRVLDLRRLARRALEYALARYTLMSVLAVPQLWIGGYVFDHRHLPLRDLVLGRVGLAVFAGVAASVIVAGMRVRWFNALDRRFFREEYDAPQILGHLIDASGTTTSANELADLIAQEVDRALHVTSIVMLFENGAAGAFQERDARLRPLGRHTMLARLLASADDPIDIEPDNTQSILRRLPPDETSWLADSGVRLLVPLRGAGGALRGILGLGEKRSELPYSRADRQLLSTVGASGGIYLDRQLATRDRSAPTTTAIAHDDAAAAECRACQRVHAAGVTACVCGSPVEPAPVPMVLAGKFRMERRIGEGGMGVVYQAQDLALGRAVAVKTLPVGDTSRTWRLRREARAMALVSHEHLALIYGVESWHGRPYLVQEYLAGGTLSTRLSAGPLPPDAVVTLGTHLAEVLSALHHANLVHRDVKPSNIGFTAAGVVKLLDFGLAQLARTATLEASAETGGEPTTQPFDALRLQTRHAIGTPAYMSPESVRHEPPSSRDDVWALGVVLLEAVTGRNPFRAATVRDTLDRVTDTHTTLRPVWPTLPVEWRAFFQSVLATDSRARPASAGAFLTSLTSLPPTSRQE